MNYKGNVWFKADSGRRILGTVVEVFSAWIGVVEVDVWHGKWHSAGVPVVDASIRCHALEPHAARAARQASHAHCTR